MSIQVTQAGQSMHGRPLGRGADRRHKSLLVLKRCLTFESLLATVAVLILIACPIGYLIFGAFRTQAPGLPSTWTLTKFGFLATAEFAHLLGNSIIIAVLSTAISFVIGVVLAISIGRLRVPGAKWLDGLLVAPGYLPPFMIALAWTMLLAPRVGYINYVLSRLGLPNIDIYSMGGIVAVTALFSSPLAYLYLRPAILNFDASLEEAAWVFGARRWRTTRKIVLAVIKPGLLSCILVVFVTILGEFSIPAVLGPNARIYTLASQLYEYVSTYPDDPNRAAVLGLFLVAISTLGILLNRRVLRRNEYVTIGNRGSRTGAAGSWTLRLLGLMFCLVYLLIAGVLPIGATVVGSLQPFLSPTFDSGWTLQNYANLVGDHSIASSMINTLLLSILAALIGSAISLLIARFASRRRNRYGAALHVVASIPLAVPHIVFGLALLWMWVSLHNLGLYGSRWILLVAYLGLFLPLGVNAISGGISQIDKSIEESAHVFGAGNWRTTTRILLPLIMPSTLSAATLILYHSVRELSASLLLYTPTSQVMSVQIWSLYVQGAYVQMFALGFVNIVIILLLVGLVNRLVIRWRQL